MNSNDIIKKIEETQNNIDEIIKYVKHQEVYYSNTALKLEQRNNITEKTFPLMKELDRLHFETFDGMVIKFEDNSKSVLNVLKIKIERTDTMIDIFNRLENLQKSNYSQEEQQKIVLEILQEFTNMKKFK